MPAFNSLAWNEEKDGSTDLFKSPREASTSQTVKIIRYQLKLQYPEPNGGPELEQALELLTPADHPHLAGSLQFLTSRQRIGVCKVKAKSREEVLE